MQPACVKTNFEKNYVAYFLIAQERHEHAGNKKMF
jgi:hypothetical protein